MTKDELVFLIERYGYARREGKHQGKGSAEWMKEIEIALTTAITQAGEGIVHDPEPFCGALGSVAEVAAAGPERDLAEQVLKKLEGLAKRYGWLAVQIGGIEESEAQLEVVWDTEVFEYWGGPSHPMADIEHTRAEALALLREKGGDGC